MNGVVIKAAFSLPKKEQGGHNPAQDAKKGLSQPQGAFFMPKPGETMKWPEKSRDGHPGGQGHSCRKDFEALYNMLHEAIALIDTHTDEALSGKVDPMEAIKAIDAETSRLLWGDQEGKMTDGNSYMNADYTDRGVAVGMSAERPAER